MSTKKNVLIIGGNGGIGAGFIEQLLDRSDIDHIFATYRQLETSEQLMFWGEEFPQQVIPICADVTDEEAVKEVVHQVKSKIDRLHLVINCVGILQEGNLQPEKSLRHIQTENLLRYFEVNTIPTALFSKHLLPLFRHPEFTVWATVSAKVGSIEDNRLGGWYGYRASKAALNMLIKNVAIEYGRVAKNTVVVALHPGTTKTSLSSPFQKNVPEGKLFSPQRTTQQLLAVIDDLTIDNTGQFFNWDGSLLPW